MIDKNEVKKELYKTKEIARFSYYAAGYLNYDVAVLGGSYQFPIPVTEVIKIPIYEDHGSGVTAVKLQDDGIQLSTDLGTTPFTNEMKASELNRWIAKAIDNNEFVKIS